MAEYRRHLLISRARAACGKPDARYFTTNPARVTCRGCSRTLAMADAELAAQSRPRKRDRRKARPL